MTLQPASPHSKRKSALIRYSLATALVLASVAIRMTTSRRLNQDLPLLGMPFAVFFAAYFGGIGPGIFGTILAAMLSAYLFIAPVGSLHVSKLTDEVRLTSFLSLGILISLLSERARRLAEKAAAHELALSESRYLTLVYQSSEAILVLHEGIIRALNTPMVQLLGPIRRQGLLNEPLIDFVHPDDKKLMQLWLSELRPGMSKAPSPLRFVRLDGSIIAADVALDVSESGRQRTVQMTLSDARSVILQETAASIPAASDSSHEISMPSGLLGGAGA